MSSLGSADQIQACSAGVEAAFELSLWRCHLRVNVLQALVNIKQLDVEVRSRISLGTGENDFDTDIPMHVGIGLVLIYSCLGGIAVAMSPTQAKHLGHQLGLDKLAPCCGRWLQKLICCVPLCHQLCNALALHVVAWRTLKTQKTVQRRLNQKCDGLSIHRHVERQATMGVSMLLVCAGRHRPCRGTCQGDDQTAQPGQG